MTLRVGSASRAPIRRNQRAECRLPDARAGRRGERTSRRPSDSSGCCRLSACGSRPNSATPASGAAAAEIAWGEQVLPLITEDPAATRQICSNALAGIFVEAPDLRLDVLRPTGAAVLGDLPTYVFRRKRCWIDEPAAQQRPRAAAAAAPARVRRPVRSASAADAGETAQAALDQELIQEYLISELKNIMHAEEDLDRTETFLEVGGDSFTAMQLTMSIEERYRSRSRSTTSTRICRSAS